MVKFASSDDTAAGQVRCGFRTSGLNVGQTCGGCVPEQLSCRGRRVSRHGTARQMKCVDLVCFYF